MQPFIKLKEYLNYLYDLNKLHLKISSSRVQRKIEKFKLVWQLAKACVIERKVNLLIKHFNIKTFPRSDAAQYYFLLA